MLQASSDSETTSPTLVNIALDLQIIICTLLHPSDILALRETCKAFQLPTRQRVVWIAALYQVCLDNCLFLPSFPILDMSDVELEHAAIAPRRWIDLCASFEKQHLDGSCTQLYPRTTRIIEHSSFAAADRPHLFIVPGGRYMVTYSPNGIFVWDLGYTSTADCKLIASVGSEGGPGDCMVQVIPDGMGLIIFSARPYERCSVYEIYPESETPRLTQIAHLGLGPTAGPLAHLLPDRMLWYELYQDKIVFKIWDYRKNRSISFSADVDTKAFGYNVEVMATKTAIIVLCAEGILVWAMPPLTPQLPDFFDCNPTHIPSLLEITFPDGIINRVDIFAWQPMSQWYFYSSKPLYFDIFCRHSKLHRFKIIVKPDLLDTSLHLINTELVPQHDLLHVFFRQYSICEDTLVAGWESQQLGQIGAYTGLTSSRFASVISHGGPAANMLLTATGHIFFLCPTSGRYVYLDNLIGSIVVVDLF